MDDDDRLMLRMQEGDSAAFEQLVERHQEPLIGFFFRNTRDVQLAEDLTQETLLRVYNQSWDYLPRGKFRSWMYRIARNLLIDNVRRRSNDALVKAVRAKGDEDNDLLARVMSEVVSPVENANTREIARLVDGFLDEIPEEQRLTFVLHHYNGLSLPDVADILDTNLPTCKSRLRLAREKLRERLVRRGVLDPNQPEQ